MHDYVLTTFAVPAGEARRTGAHVVLVTVGAFSAVLARVLSAHVLLCNVTQWTT